MSRTFRISESQILRVSDSLSESLNLSESQSVMMMVMMVMMVMMMVMMTMMMMVMMIMMMMMHQRVRHQKN